MEWHMRAEDPTEKTLADLKRQVGLLVGMFGEDREKAHEIAREVIERVQRDLQEREQAQAAPMEEEGMSKEMRER
eukprot:10176974-Alexandrium_andersonii.AAC.1